MNLRVNVERDNRRQIEGIQYVTQQNIENEILLLQVAAQASLTQEEEADKDNEKIFLNKLKQNGEERVKQYKTHLKQ